MASKTSVTDLGPQMKPFNHTRSRRLGKNTVPNYSSQKAESKRETRVNRNGPDCLTHTTWGCPPYSLHAQKSVLATVDREIPFGFRRRVVRKVITALIPASLLQFLSLHRSLKICLQLKHLRLSKYGKIIKKPRKVTKSILLMSFLQSLS